MRWMGSESAPSPTRSQASASSRNGDSGAVPIQRGNGESQVKQIKDVFMFDGYKSQVSSLEAKFSMLGQASRVIWDTPENTMKGSVQITGRHLQPTVVFVCFLPIYSGRQFRWKYQPGSHRIYHPPSFCGACLYFSREKDSAVPFPRRP